MGRTHRKTVDAQFTLTTHCAGPVGVEVQHLRVSTRRAPTIGYYSYLCRLLQHRLLPFGTI